MEKLLKELLESAKKDKKGLRQLKNTAVRCQNFELASQLRGLELKLFPETKEQKEAKKLVKELDLVFRNVGLAIDPEKIWVIQKAIEVYKKKKMQMNMRDASQIVAKARELFDEE
jgi:hypothetical protein